MKRKMASQVFGDASSTYVSLVSTIASQLSEYKYEFVPHDEFVRITDAAYAMHIYWREILYRSHLSAATSILRTQRWLESVLWSADHINAVSFATCFRGLLESAADTNDSLATVPTSLALYRRIILEALNKQLFNGHAILAEELENLLIHFTHARKVKQGETAPSTHRAKTAKDYFDSMNVSHNHSKILDCYSYLCEFTHPSAMSVVTFLVPFGNTGRIWRLDSKGDHKTIEEFCSSYADIMPDIMTFAVLTPIAILKILNALPMQSLHTKYLDRVDITLWPWWQEAWAAFTSDELPLMRSENRKKPK
jgi:hypothetical protein